MEFVLLPQVTTERRKILISVKEDFYFCEPEINELNRKGMDRS